MRNKILNKIIAAAMVLSVLFTLIPTVLAVQNTITISSKDDFIEFAKNCTLDTWSQGKTVNLTCDIDFTGDSFTPVPTFGGIFNGNGYTIYGIEYPQSGSYIGLFRYVQQCGKIENLNIKAVFTPNGSKSFIGGIAGENYGIIDLCNFEGTVKGENVIGGIVGNNSNSGQIISCTAAGNITGENFTGGIAGKNSGFIQSCTNDATVNTMYEEKKNEISDIDADSGAIIENLKNTSEEKEEDSILGHSDTGGTVGYSSGIIQGCINNADIGYQHIGYNVGGIAGRQSGYMLGCHNYGHIYGRKDVGGIVGQAEPYILLQTSEGGLKNIHNELDKLNTIVNRFITDVDDLGTDTEKYLTDISQYSKNAQSNAEILINQGTDFIDDNLNEINTQSAILSNTLDNLVPAFENLESGGENLGEALDKVRDSLDNADLYFPELSDEFEDIGDSLSEISKAQSDTKKAVLSVKNANRRLESAVKFDNQPEVKKSLSELSDSIKNMIIAKQSIKNQLTNIETILSTKPENFEDIGINAKEIIQSIKYIKENVDITILSLKSICESIDTIILNTEISFSKFKSAAKNIESAIEEFGDAVNHITGGLGDLGVALENFSDKFNDYSDDISDEVSSLKDDLSDAITSLSYATDNITGSIKNIKDILNDLSQEDSLEFVTLGDDFKNANENLFNSLSDISNKLDMLKDIISDEQDDITENLTSITHQFDLIIDLFADEIENLHDDTTTVSDIFLDVSDEDIENTKQGKISECHNLGTIEADRNTGGISGAMAIEYTKDPEDDIEKPDTLNFTYRTKAILHNCINDGNVVCKKDCAGGIAGLSEIGTIYGCQNYADTASSNGNYVGGIVGKSKSSVRKSYAKCSVSGKRYIGGIAGKADVMTACFSIATINGEENIGAICGDSENTDKLYKNFYVDNGCGAVDSISYNEKAMSITFEELAALTNIPTRFVSFTVTFIADNEIVEVQDIKYGDDTAKIIYPPIPSKDGHFGNWQKTEAKKVTENIEILCEYSPYITTLASSEKNDNGKLALGLVEGEFDDKAELHITDSSSEPPVNPNSSIKVYNISLCHTDIQENETVAVRILNENKSKVTAWILNGNNWEKVKTSDKGKYTILETNGTQNTICLKYTENNFNIIWIILIAIIIISLICLLMKKQHTLKQKQLLSKRNSSKDTAEKIY